VRHHAGGRAGGIKVYLGEVEGQPHLAAPQRSSSIRDVLRHTAGFGNDDDSWVGARYREVDPIAFGSTLKEFLRKLASVPLLYVPGTRWYYGPSVDVQARLVEVLTGQPFAQVMRARVLEPLGMQDTQYTVRADK
jgi:CubicO group peptidase (beta-lactamase class C family)